MTLGDVCRHRNGRASKLGGETKSFIQWQLLPHLVGLDHQADTELPDVKVAIAAYHEGRDQGRVQGKRSLLLDVTDPIHLQPLIPDS